MKNSNHIEELNGFKLLNILTDEEIEERKIMKVFSAFELIEFCFNNNIKSQTFSPIKNPFKRLEGDCIEFDLYGNLISDINKLNTNGKYVIEIDTDAFENALDLEFKEGVLWIYRASEDSSYKTPYTTIADIMVKSSLEKDDVVFYHNGEEFKDLAIKIRD